MGKSYIEKHLTVREETYDAIKEIAKKNHRTMRGQLEFLVAQEQKKGK